MFAWLKKQKPRKEIAARLYGAVQAQARQRVFFAEKGVPDTFDGRFELLLVHAFLVWNRLKAEGPQGLLLAQDLFDVMFRDIHQALRHIGVGDLGVPHHAKRMMRAFKGRALAYDGALNAVDEPDMILSALRRNLFGTVSGPSVDHLQWFADYMAGTARSLARQDPVRLLDGRITFETVNEQKSTPHADARMVA